MLAVPKGLNEGLDDPAQNDRTNQLRGRVGTNILVAAGYLAQAHFVQDRIGKPPLNYYVLEPDGRAADCASPYALVPEDVIEGGDAAFAVGHAARIALAIVAVEKFNRNAIHRFAEISYARLYRKVFGRLPDLSFGPA